MSRNVAESTADILGRLPNPMNALSVLEGNTEGSIFSQPEKEGPAVLVWEKNNGLFLAGTPSRGAAEGLRGVLEDEVFPKMKAQGRTMSHLLHTPEWSSDIMVTLLGGRTVDHYPRRIYPAVSNVGAVFPLPFGIKTAPIDEELMEGHLEGVSPLLSHLDATWSDRDTFLLKGGGLCAVSGNVIVGYCMFEYAYGNERGLVVEVTPGHRRKGVAAALVTACLNMARKRSWRAIWGCDESNTASVALAEKVGFRDPISYVQGRFRL